MQVMDEDSLGRRRARPVHYALTERCAHASQPSQSTAPAKVRFLDGGTSRALQGSPAQIQVRPRCTADRLFQEEPEENPQACRKHTASARHAGAVNRCRHRSERPRRRSDAGAEKPSPATRTALE
jgi:hypothetical protein